MIVKLCDGSLPALVTGGAAAAGIGLTDYEHLITEATSPGQHRQAAASAVNGSESRQNGGGLNVLIQANSKQLDTRTNSANT